MNILTLIFNSIFSVVANCFNAIDIDMFGIGFTILDFFIAVLILGLVFRFLGKSVNVADRFNLFNLLGSTSLISNSDRESQIVKFRRTKSYDVNNDSTSFTNSTTTIKGNDTFVDEFHYFVPSKYL